MTRTFKSLNDSDLELACGGSSLIVDSLDQTSDVRRHPDASDDSVTALQSALASFKTQFVTSSGQPLIKDTPVDALEDEADALSVTKKVRKAPPTGTAGKTS